jgi:hypothetical protein
VTGPNQALYVEVDDDAVASGGDGVVQHLIEQHGVELVKYGRELVKKVVKLSAADQLIEQYDVDLVKPTTCPCTMTNGIQLMEEVKYKGLLEYNKTWPTACAIAINCRIDLKCVSARVRASMSGKKIKGLNQRTESLWHYSD